MYYKNVTLSNNTATKYGGAIYIFGSNALIENTITFNNTAYNGGSIYINDKFSTIKNTTFLNNTAKNLKDGTAGYGGEYLLILLHQIFKVSFITIKLVMDQQFMLIVLV